MIRCPKCRVANSDRALYCNLCGAWLKGASAGRSCKKWYSVLFLAVFALAALVVLWHFSIARQTVRTSANQLSKPGLPEVAMSPSPQPQSSAEQPSGTPLELTTGSIEIKDIAGITTVYSATVVDAAGWVALPRQRILGGYEWHLHLQPDRQAVFVDGIQGDRDDVGLWRVVMEDARPAAEIAVWRPGGTLKWIAVADLSARAIAGVTIKEEQRWFTQVTMPEPLAEDGIIVQDEGIVGWTFAEYPGRGYMWRGPESAGIVADVRVDDHYRLTFAGSREEALILALSLGTDVGDARRLAELANAFRFEPRLDDRAGFSHLSAARIAVRMRLLIDRLEQADLAADVANVFDAAVLASIADVDLTTAVVETTRQVYGHEDALWLLEDVTALWPSGNPTASDRFADFRSKLYQDWIRVTAADADSVRARQVFERARAVLPNDPRITLLGARLALADNDWETAERLLQGMLFPAELADDIEMLQMRISAIKARENKLVIRFDPGSKQIPVTATLNEGLEQRFLVDTGATLVTIPMSTAERLGLSQLDRLPRRTVYTAGGTRQAPEVVLASISIDGWQVENVRALVLDLPQQSDLGLLGLNFLNRFQLDLNSQQGVLMLTPR